jgi:Phosphotransferase enzyme family
LTKPESIPARLAVIELDTPLASALGATSLRLRRAWPRHEDHLLLEYTTPNGRIVGAQWMRDPQGLEHVAAQVQACAPAGRSRVQRAGELNVLIQPGGADRCLEHLAEFLARSHGILISHRVERRAVVGLQDDGGRCVKFSRKTESLRGAVDRGRAIWEVAGRSFVVPRPLEVNELGRWVAWSVVPGQTWQRAIIDGGGPGMSGTVGKALRELHAIAPPLMLPRHDGEAEARVLGRWTDWASRYGLMSEDRIAEEGRVKADLVADGSPMCLVHRDFHDRQVLVGAGGTVGIIDFDTLAIGEPAVDLGNALAHLDLAAAQGLASSARIAEHADAFLSAYQPPPETLARVPVYEKATRLRLECLHAFRPRPPATLHLAADSWTGSGCL